MDGETLLELSLSREWLELDPLGRDSVIVEGKESWGASEMGSGLD